MAELEGGTLGQKHQHYNALVQNQIKNNKTVNVEDFNIEDSDIINLVNIDLASHNKNVEYILRVLTCDDMLYVSRAIKQADWLINDNTYAHIINPDYLQTNLYPSMCTKAIIKLGKHIRCILKDEKRAEQFYYHEKNPEDAVKWLPRCSVEFILKNIANRIKYIKLTLLKRLCEKSKTVLETYMKNVGGHENSEAFQVCIFLLPSNTDWFLDLVEAKGEYNFPTFNKKNTTILIKNCASRVIDKFDKYFHCIHLPTFIKSLKRDNIKDFLVNQAKNMNEVHFYTYFNVNRMMDFIRLMPQEIRFEFVNDVFINKTHESKENCSLSKIEIRAMHLFCNASSYCSHIWYQFAPFNIALQKVQELIDSGSSVRYKVSLLHMVLKSAQNNLLHERTFLEYLRDTHKNAENEVIEEILIKLILTKNFINYDITTWNVLDAIFKRIDVYNQSKDSKHEVIEAIILYNVIHNEKVSAVVENKFKFNTLFSYHKKLAEREKEIIFNYLYDLILAKLTKCKATKQEEFKEKVETLELTLKLLKDYGKNLDDYPSIINIIRDLIKLKNNQSWTVSLDALFNVKKTWRKSLFEESLSLCQNKYVLLNALKHDSSLLERNDVVVKNMLHSDKLPLNQVLAKIKIYWTSSLAKNITIIYMDNLNGLGNHKVTTKGLSILLPFRQLQEIIEKYTPEEPKVDWEKIDEVELSVQQQFAKNMHFSRRHPFPKVILRFAKGDYLQYALPSVHAIFYNLNILESERYIPHLLDAPVSLQKHGIRLAVSKLKYEQLLSILSNVWKCNKNASIRSITFKTVYELLCKQKDLNKIKTTWELLEALIDNITFNEDKAIYKLLLGVEKVPLEIRGLFYMKSYNLLRQLINSGDKYKNYKDLFYTKFTAYSREIIEQLKPDFVDGIIIEYVAEEFTKEETHVSVWCRGCVVSLISSYMLCVADEHTQLERYEKTLLPILKQSFSLWNDESFIRINVTKLLHSFRCDIEQYVINMKKVIPYKMFLLIQEELNSALNIQANYLLLTKWKLTVTFVSILDENRQLSDWEQIWLIHANKFGNMCTEYLKEDCSQYFPRIYLLFVKPLNSMLNDFIPKTAHWEIYKTLTQDNDFIQGYLAAILLLSDIGLSDNEEDERNRRFQELCKAIREHPSTEVKIHYFDKINK